MRLKNVILILERALLLGMVVVKVVVQALPQQIQAVQVVKALYVRGVAAAVLGADLDLGFCEAGSGGEVLGDDGGAIWEVLVSIFVGGFNSRCCSGGGIICIQSTPRLAHAASTTGPAASRNSFFLKRDPLKWTSENWILTSSNNGAAILKIFSQQFFRYR